MTFRVLCLPNLLACIFASAVSGDALPDTPVPAKMPEPKLVTLHAVKIPLAQILDDVAKQTGIRVAVGSGLADELVSVDLRHATFWKALDVIAEAAKGNVQVNSASGRIIIGKSGVNYRQPLVCEDGRFRLTLKSVSTSRNLELRDNDKHAGITNVVMEAAWDPLLLPLYLETRPHNLRLVDDRGRILTIPDEGSSLAPVDGRIALGFDLHLPALPRSIASIRSLQGELTMIGPSKMLAFTFDRLDRLANANPNDPERRLTQEGVSCRVLNVVLDHERWSIRVALDYPPGMKQLDTNQSWVVNNEMTLESADGKARFPSTNYVLESANARQAVVSYHFRDRADSKRGKSSQWRVSYRTPANLVEMPIRFTFKDVPLP